MMMKILLKDVFLKAKKELRNIQIMKHYESQKEVEDHEKQISSEDLENKIKISQQEQKVEERYRREKLVRAHEDNQDL